MTGTQIIRFMDSLHVVSQTPRQVPVKENVTHFICNDRPRFIFNYSPSRAPRSYTSSIETDQCVSVDGTSVLKKSGPFHREWRNIFPWRRRQDRGYEVHPTADGMEVRLKDTFVWGVKVGSIPDEETP